MNDRYLCKAKRTDNGEWVEGYYRYIPCLDEHYIMPKNPRNKLEGWEVVSDTICQCTGLKNKDGKLIWENDIVAYFDAYSTENGYSEAGCVGKVVWDDETMSFQVTERLSAESYEIIDECHIIGSAIDNPELLEVGEC